MVSAMANSLLAKATVCLSHVCCISSLAHSSLRKNFFVINLFGGGCTWKSILTTRIKLSGWHHSHYKVFKIIHSSSCPISSKQHGRVEDRQAMSTRSVKVIAPINFILSTDCSKNITTIHLHLFKKLRSNLQNEKSKSKSSS